jgi:hypothetical protein
VRFPPHKKVEDLVVGQTTLFYLRGTNVLASLKPWNGDVEPIGQLEEIWVQIKGIPPKWADWWTIKDVASSLGLLSEVDWTTLFSIFFSTTRIKIKCKDPVRIPKERVYEMGGSCYLVSFTAEGVGQIEDHEDNDGKGDDGKGDDGKGNDDDGKGDDDDPKEDDLLDDDSDGDLNQDKDKAQEDRNSKQKEQSGSKKIDQTNAASSSKSQKGSKAVRRSLEFLEDFHELSLEHTSCVILLNAMELEGSDGEETNSLAGHLNDPVIDEEMSNLPMEWVDNLTSLRRSPNREVIPGVLTTHDSANPEASIVIEPTKL